MHKLPRCKKINANLIASLNEGGITDSTISPMYITKAFGLSLKDDKFKLFQIQLTGKEQSGEKGKHFLKLMSILK